MKGQNMKIENKLPWRRLDNSAKIFPMSTGEKYSTVFRISALLKNDIHPEILQKAVESTLEKYEAFKVRMKAGLFWYYLEQHKTGTAPFALPQFSLIYIYIYERQEIAGVFCPLHCLVCVSLPTASYSL